MPASTDSRDIAPLCSPKQELGLPLWRGQKPNQGCGRYEPTLAIRTSAEQDHVALAARLGEPDKNIIRGMGYAGMGLLWHPHQR